RGSPGPRAARAGAARLRGAARLEGDHRRRARVQGAAGERAQVRRGGGGPGRRGGERRVGGGGAGADHRAEESVPARIVATRTLALRSCLEDVMTEAIIVDAVRTARGKRKGSLSAVHPVDLLAQTLTASLAHAGVKPTDVDDVIMGCVTQVGEQGLNIARGAVLAAGMPIDIPGTTVNRFCGSGLQAVNFGAQAVLSAASQLAGAGGVEPMKLPDGRAFDRDEHPRPGTTVETLATLKPSFKEDGVLHAGNSSGIVDGAAAVVIASKGHARSLGLKPRASIVSMAVVGSDP